MRVVIGIVAKRTQIQSMRGGKGVYSTLTSPIDLLFPRLSSPLYLCSSFLQNLV